MIFGIYPNLNKDRNLIHTKKLIEAISRFDNADFFVCEDISARLPEYKALEKEELARRADVVITLGGDGTILKIVKWCALYGTPILGINLGTIGFLTEVEDTDYYKVILAILSNEFRVEKRTMLKSITAKGTYYSLNEIMVGHARNLKMVPTDVYIDGEFYYCYYADGVMVATPTGSTGYSLSAGGPVLSPTLSGFVINGVCPHSLHNKPVVIGENQIVTLKTHESRRALLTSDGEMVEELDREDSVTVQRSEYDACFIRLEKSNFYDRLIDKLNHWSNTGRRK